MKLRMNPELSIVLGAIATYFVNYFTNPVFGAALVGLFAGFLLPKYSSSLYVGAFIGMSSLEVLPELYLVLAASIISAFFWRIFTTRTPSFGGKAGFTAFLGVLVIALGNVWNHNFYEPVQIVSETILAIIFVAMAATIATFELRKRLEKAGFRGEAVIGSAAIGIIPGFLSMFFPLLSTLSEVAFASSFAGMTEFKLIKEEYYAVLIGLIVGSVFFFSAPFFQGFGGKLGTIAFVSVILFLYVTKA
jgi:hypothetical protein